MAKSLSKVEKKITKKKGKITNLHDKSRDAKRLRHAVEREAKLKRQAAENVKINQGYGTMDYRCRFWA